MPRRAFLADIKKLADEGSSLDRISTVQHGPDDDQFQFTLSVSGVETAVIVQVSDTSLYPEEHQYYLFVEDGENDTDGVHDLVAQTLQGLSGVSSGPVAQLLQTVARATNSSASMDGSDACPSDLEDFGVEDASDVDEEDEDDWPDDDLRPTTNGQPRPTASPEFIQNVRSDLRAVRDAGFKVSCVSDILAGSPCYVGVSCRASKLGISEEAMRAWNIDINDYIMLVLYYPQAYKPCAELRSVEAKRAQDLVKMRVGKSRTYKLSVNEVVDLFHERQFSRPNEANGDIAMEERKFESFFISKPLGTLLNDRLISLINHRLKRGLTWKGAEDFHDLHQGRMGDDSSGSHDEGQPDPANDTYPKRVTADHLTSGTLEGSLSFPLIAMQFFLRHFVRCTEFCLVCHCKLDTGLEAIKPYVCEKPLCLYQYMSLGFGPSIEHEICSQPRVVDLLVSFCYASAKTGRLNDFPTGMEIQLPGRYGSDTEQSQSLSATWTPSKNSIVFKEGPCPVREGDWINVTDMATPAGAFHARVIDATSFPFVVVGHLRHIPTPPNRGLYHQPKPKSSSEDMDVYPAKVFLYQTRFDDLPVNLRRQAIYEALDILPSLGEMKNTLQSRPKDGWTALQETIPVSSLSILRWIIASSRACILEVGSPTKDANGEWVSQSTASDRIGGMDGWMQFRFAMGAPDKERRFQASVQSVISRLNPPYPTFFAWHGSPLRNWHAIVREGLRFDLGVSHGRSFGDGVYHSLQVGTSIGYAGYGHMPLPMGVDGSPSWPNSSLNINSAIALNEIVNAPSEFTSRNPHLVVQYREWIQTRYLLVNCGAATTVAPRASIDSTSTKGLLQQDPKMSPVGFGQNMITIPESAVPRSRRRNSVAIKIGHKKLKGEGSQAHPILMDVDGPETLDDDASICTTDSDAAIVEPQGTTQEDRVPGTDDGMAGISQDSDTNYVPYTIDKTNLPLMSEPSWASPGASKRLLQELKEVLKTQKEERPSVLGWHVDDRFTDNLYQWIIELHSFDKDLPLAADMKQSNITSIVLELRFGPNFPLSPPFVRVIGPRFLPFLHGGGGHVTAGGAMCMELLTNSGWSPAQNLENVILQVRMAMTSTEPRPARLAGGGGQTSAYGVEEAAAAFVRACRMHNWEVPSDFLDIARASGVTVPLV